MEKDVKISVAIRAYNQEKEVAKALDSVVAQSFEGPVEIVLGVDVSTDHTLAVVKEYCSGLGDKFHCTIIEHKERQGGTGNLIATLKACTGEYIAILDADDYWIDEDKNKKQALILDENPDIGLVYGNHVIESVNLNGRLMEMHKPEVADNVFTQLLYGNNMGTCCVMFRAELLSYVDFDLLLEKNWSQDDYYIWLEFANHTKFYHINDFVAAYTITRDANGEHIPYDACKYDASTTEVKEHYIRKYPDHTDLTVSDVWDAHYRLQFRAARLVKDYDFAVEAINAMSNPHKLPLLYKLCRNRLIWNLYVRRYHKKHQTDGLNRYFI